MNSVIDNSRVSRVLDSSRVEMSSLCPHQFQEYLKKVSEILETYKPQILASVQYIDVSSSLLKSKIIKKREHLSILKTEDGTEQVAKVLHIVKKRMWGLENFMTALIEGKKETWLSKELFQAYVRHLVTHMKKLQVQPLCDCFFGGKNSGLYSSWLKALDTFDGYLNNIGTSLGFLTLSVHPVNGILEFIRRRLPISRQEIVTVTQADAESSESSEEENEPNDLEWDSTGDFHGFESDLDDKPETSLNSKAQRPVKESPKPRPKINPTRKSAQNQGPSTSSKAVRPRQRTLSNPRSKIPPMVTVTAKKSTTPKPPIIARKIAPQKARPIAARRAETGSKINSVGKGAVSSRVQKSHITLNKSITVKIGNGTGNDTTTIETADFRNDIITTETVDSGNDTITTETTYTELNEKLYDTHGHAEFEKLYSISLGTSFGSDEDLRFEPAPNTTQDALRDLTASPFFNLSDDNDDYFDDDAFLPAPPVRSLGITTGSPQHSMSEKIKINGNSKMHDDTRVVCATTEARDSTASEKSNSVHASRSQSEIAKQFLGQAQAPRPSTSPPVPVPKLIETKNIWTQTIVAEPETKSEPEIKKSVESVSICTQTTPPSSPKLSKRRNSYPGGLSDKPVHFLINPNVFRSFEVKKSETISKGHEKIEDSSEKKPLPEKKPLSRKSSGHTSTVRKIINSAVSAFKHSSSSEKKLSRTMSTTSAKTPAATKQKELSRSASVSTSTSPRISLIGKSPTRTSPGEIPATRKASTEPSSIRKPPADRISSRPSSAEISSSRKTSTETASIRKGLGQRISSRPFSVEIPSSRKSSTEISSVRLHRPSSTSAVPAIAKKLVPSMNKGKLSAPVTKPGVTVTVTPKVPSVPLRQRVHAEIRENKAHAPAPPPPVNQDRLAPNDYNLQQLTNAWVAKQNKMEAGVSQNNNNNNNV